MRGIRSEPGPKAEGRAADDPGYSDACINGLSPARCRGHTQQAGVLDGGNAAGVLAGMIIKQAKSGNPSGEFATTMTEQRQSQA